MRAWLWTETGTGMPRIVRAALMATTVALSVGAATALDWVMALRAAAGRCP